VHDVAVVGAGVAGASCAYHLAERGASVIVLEREHPAAGSSGRSAAFIETLYTDPDRVRWTQWSARFYERLGIPFVQHGKLQLAHDDAQLARFARTLELREDDGARVVDASTVAELAPRLSTGDLAGAVYGPRDGWIDPPTLCSRLLEGIDVRRQNVAAPRGLDARTVVLAAGAWVSELYDVPVRGERRTIELFEDDDPRAGDTPLVVDPVGDEGDSLYLRGDGGRLVLAGFHSEQHGRDEELVPLLAARWCEPDALRHRGGWAGLYPLTPDGAPILGEAEPGVHLLAGLGGNGIQLGGALGRVAADLVLDGGSELLPDPVSYSATRFA
jgi:glycine/D-amino acid oxidase-like deaminating enzyme